MIEIDDSVGQKIYTMIKIRMLEYNSDSGNLLFQWFTEEGDDVIVGTDLFGRAGVLIKRDNVTIRSYSGEPAEKVLAKTWREFLKGYVIDYSCMIGEGYD